MTGGKTTKPKQKKLSGKGQKRRREQLKILFIASEMFPLAKTGGLADVIGSLPKALSKLGHDVRVLLPKYRTTFNTDHNLERVAELNGLPFGNFTLGCGIDESDALENDGVYIYLIEHLDFYCREHLYGYHDDWLRFGLLSRVALELPNALKWKPDVIHCNDWQSGLVPTYLHTIYKNDEFFANTATVFTVHNLAYQGNFDPSLLSALSLPSEIFQVRGIEFWGKVSFLKGGLYYSDMITTVSPQYAREIQTERFGEGLHGLLTGRFNEGCFVGILNGIDDEVWNPKTDQMLPMRYDIRSIVKGKDTNKQELLRRVGLTDGNEMIIGIVSRLAQQKGFDIVVAAADEFLKLPVKLVVLGAGEQEPAFYDLQKRYPDKVATRLGVVDEELAHLIYAGSDAFLMPSRFEPCGLGQMIAMAYATVVIAHSVGGLKDTVQDFDPTAKTGTGFTFSPLTTENLIDAIKRAVSIYRNNTLWRTIQRNAMKADFSWEKSAQAYEKQVYLPALKLAKARVSQK